MFCHNHEALTTPSPLPGQAALRGRVAAHPGRHCPGRVLLRLPRHHHAAERRCSLAIIAAGLGSGSMLTEHVGPPRHLRRLGHEQSMATTVFGLRREQGLDNWVASSACSQRCPLQRSRQKPRHSTPTMSSSPGTSSLSPLPKTPWTAPSKRRQTTTTTRPCQTRRLSDMPLAPASTHPMSNLERCIALRLVYGAGPR